MSLRRITPDAWVGTVLFALLLGLGVAWWLETPITGAATEWVACLTGTPAIYLSLSLLARHTWLGYGLTRPGAALMAMLDLGAVFDVLSLFDF